MQVLEHTDDTLVLYSYWERTPTCSSVPHIALDHLGEGILFETRHERRHYTWRIIHSGEGTVSAFFDDLDDAIGDCAQIEMLRVMETSASTDSQDDNASGLPPNQEEALRAAVEHGYYETPREVDVGELADHLDVPRSTLTYRLRRAEEQMAKQRVAHNPPSEVQSTPL